MRLQNSIERLKKGFSPFVCSRDIYARLSMFVLNGKIPL